MALGNWDTLAVDLEGKTTSGIFISPLGIQVEIYKNWIYVKDEHAWRKKGHFTGSTVMEIQHGQIDYMDVYIIARRGPQNGVFVVCHSLCYSDEPTICMVGCGVSGYDGDEWIGVKKSSKDFLQKWISADHQVCDENDIKRMMESASHMSSEELRDYEKSLRERYSDFPKEIAQVNLDNALRFNQGDRFFADKLKINVPATPVEETLPPMLS